jgi:hypothetical protein
MFRMDGSINSAQGPALNGVLVYVCTQPAVTTTIPPSPLASLFTNSAGTTPLANPVVSDGLGNWFFYAATGTYTIVYFDPIGRIPTTVFADQQVVSPGGGSVTSVAMTGDNVIFQTAVGGSPIIAAGTLIPALKNFNANTFLRGPTSGGAATPTVGPIVAADLVGLVGSVTSVTLGLSASALFTASITGTNPITGAGTFTLNLALAAQNANSFLAGPVSGAPGATTSRLMVPADQPGQAIVAFSSTPAFNAATVNSFTITLTGNVTSTTITNPTTGQTITFIITQNVTGGWTFAWPANTKGASNVAPDANGVMVQSFIYDGANWRATGPGQWNPS